MIGFKVVKMNRVTEAVVKIWGQDAGFLLWDEKRRLARFEYTKEFCKTGIELSPLKMPLSENTVYEFPELRENDYSSTFCGLPGIFADSLPEKFGNTIMKTWLEENHIDFSDLNPVERLCYVGRRGMGALEYEPVLENRFEKDERIDFNELVDIARKVLLEQENKNEVVHNQNDLLEQLMKIGTSAGGAKAKAIIALKFKDGKPFQVFSGQGEPKKDLSYWIVKFSDVKNGEHKSDLFTGRLEYAYYLMAKNCGIDMMPSRIINDSNGTGHFITRRFDRDNGKKNHMATFCGLAHEDRNPPGMTSYEKLFDTARTLRLDYSEVEQLYSRMVFNILARNQDDHSKNHSFLLSQDGKWRISPAYDLCFSFNKNSKWIAVQQMRCNGKRDDFTLNDLLSCAEKADIKNPKEIIKNVATGLSTWRDCTKKAGFPDIEAEKIESLFRNSIIQELKAQRTVQGEKSFDLER